MSSYVPSVLFSHHLGGLKEPSSLKEPGHLEFSQCWGPLSGRHNGRAALPSAWTPRGRSLEPAHPARPWPWPVCETHRCSGSPVPTQVPTELLCSLSSLAHTQRFLCHPHLRAPRSTHGPGIPSLGNACCCHVALAMSPQPVFRIYSLPVGFSLRLLSGSGHTFPRMGSSHLGPGLPYQLRVMTLHPTLCPDLVIQYQDSHLATDPVPLTGSICVSDVWAPQ